MATTKEFCEYVLDCLPAGMTAKRMMGEYCLYYHGTLVGLLCDNTLLVKRTPTSDLLLACCTLQYPYEGSKTLMYAVEDFENREMMQQLFEGLFFELQK